VSVVETVEWPSMKTTDSRLQDLRDQIAEAQARSPRFYGPELKRNIVAYAEERRARGATIRQLATELGLSYGGLCAWLRHARSRQASKRIPFERYGRRARNK
jgi:transposase-like protein